MPHAPTTTETPKMPKARKRKRRTNTKNVSSRPALLLSTLPLAHIDLRPGAGCIVCPDCSTWVPITGLQGANPKLVPHHRGTVGTADARRCLGSNRRVTLDHSRRAWEAWQRRMESGCSPASRHGTTLVKRPVPSAPPASRIRAATYEQLLAALVLHDSACRACQRAAEAEGGVRIGGERGRVAPGGAGRRCETGYTLHARMAAARRTARAIRRATVA
ncbi:hypothetical protein SAMN05421773_12729 [Streptomyces aidingensis]|uniref:Uncharacterized protein n=2 Tax=Streptomyces aidingensis TaxID=910347 RepID=A0A1I1UY96_9ACTN|nr:hypothetical protein SAMN05421773_12729 [Streptomyces aidingensis]